MNTNGYYYQNYKQKHARLQYTARILKDVTYARITFDFFQTSFLVCQSFVCTVLFVQFCDTRHTCSVCFICSTLSTGTLLTHLISICHECNSLTVTIWVNNLTFHLEPCLIWRLHYSKWSSGWSDDVFPHHQ